MDLILDNEISKNKTVDTDVNSFVKELKNSLTKEELNNTLEKEKPFDTVIANKIYSENSIAVKYKDQLEDIIEECFENMSYEKDFYYFDYDKENDVYYLDEYSKGEITRTEYTKEEFEDSVYTLGSFWRPYGDTGVVEAKYMGDGITLDVNSELDMLDWKNSKEKKK